MSESISSFVINIEESELTDLRQRLEMTRWPERECVEDWSQGVPLGAVKDLSQYWLSAYDWRRCEQRLNQYPHFKTQIDELNIHFIHVRSPHAHAKPLIITHGWPGSVIEFLNIIGPLTEPEKYGGDPSQAFHLVLPSLPGFGFSDKPCQTGWGMERIAKAWIELMSRLGYQKFLAQGGDWGSGITSWIAKLNPSACQAIHLNLVVPGLEPDTDNMSEDEQQVLADLQFYMDWDSGYSKQQATRPQTIGYGLVDSPVALMSWILEKFYFWTDHAEHEVSVVDNDQLLDNIMMYWLNASGASSARLYWESFNDLFDQSEVLVPTGVTIFPKEIIRASQRWAKKRYPNIHYWNHAEKGGHFAAFEQPTIFIHEIRQCFEKFSC